MPNTRGISVFRIVYLSGRENVKGCRSGGMDAALEECGAEDAGLKDPALRSNLQGNEPHLYTNPTTWRAGFALGFWYGPPNGAAGGAPGDAEGQGGAGAARGFRFAGHG